MVRSTVYVCRIKSGAPLVSIALHDGHACCNDTLTTGRALIGREFFCMYQLTASWHKTQPPPLQGQFARCCNTNIPVTPFLIWIQIKMLAATVSTKHAYGYLLEACRYQHQQ